MAREVCERLKRKEGLNYVQGRGNINGWVVKALPQWTGIGDRFICLLEEEGANLL